MKILFIVRGASTIKRLGNPALDEDVDPVIIPSEVDAYTDEENFDDDFLNIGPFPQ